MKKRHGFVSNSSSSSFTCTVCGQTYAGYDISFSDYELVTCINNHLFCESHLVIPEGVTRGQMYLEFAEYQDELYKDRSWHTPLDAETRKTYLDEEEEPDEWRTCGVMPAYCPICRLDSIMEESELRYTRKVTGVNSETRQQEIRERFTNFEALNKFLKED